MSRQIWHVNIKWQDLVSSARQKLGFLESPNVVVLKEHSGILM